MRSWGSSCREQLFDSATVFRVLAFCSVVPFHVSPKSEFVALQYHVNGIVLLCTAYKQELRKQL